MYLDVSCHDRLETEDSVRDALFGAIKHNLKGVSINTYFLQPMKDFIVEGMALSVPIDYPYGASEASVRSHSVLTAIRKGANTIDLVGNNNLLANEKMGKFYDDVEGIQALCKENGVTLRVMLEYRLYEPEKVVRIGSGLRELGIEYIFPATGSQPDDWTENLIMAVDLTKTGLKVITNGNIWKKKFVDTIRESEVFGARLPCYSAVKNIFELNGV